MNYSHHDAATPAPAGDDRYVVLPFYLLCDVSGSMTPHIATLNQSLRDFRDSLAKDPVLSDKVQFGVVDFADDASEVVPLSDFSTAGLESRPLACRGGTSYAAAFTAIRETIERDVTAGAHRYKFFRPAVFFLTDGYPNGGDGWEQTFSALTQFDPETARGFRYYPLFVPFGIGDADAHILRRLVHPQDRSALFMANSGTTPAAAIQAMTKGMLQSVLKSGRSALSGKPQHVLPTQAEVGTDVAVYRGGDFVC